MHSTVGGCGMCLKFYFKSTIQMIRLTGSPQTAARQLIAHLKVTGRWPEEDGERDSRNLPSDETQGVEQRGMDQADEKFKQAGR